MMQITRTEPFIHCIVDGLFDRRFLHDAAAAWPAPHWNGWYIYDTPLERKRALPTWQWMPLQISTVMMQLGCLFPECLKIRGVLPDMALHGAGMHDMIRGDFLSLHLDADRHPATGLERRVNAILFLNEGWKPEWGGHLELWDAERTKAMASIEPIFNRLVLFESSDVSYHGVTKPLTCPEGIQRKSLAMYWWGLPRSEGSRPRARFVPTADEEPDSAKDSLREVRSLLGRPKS